MYVAPTQLLLNTLYGTNRLSKVETNIYDTLSASLTRTFDPNASGSPTTTLLDLSVADPSGLTMFDVLAQSHGFKFAVAGFLAAYQK